MAITIHQSPGLYTPVYNPMRFVISSTNSGQSNFQYIVDVYTSGTSGFTRLLFPPDPSTGRAAPDVQGIIESYISHDISDSAYGFQQCTNSLKAYEIKFGEQYGALGSIQNYTDLTVTGTKYAWNGVFAPQDFIPSTFNYTLYTMGGGGAFLTDSSETQYYSNFSSDNRWLYFINDTSGTAYFLKVKTYDVNGTLIQTARIENSYQASSSIGDKLLRVGVGGEDLNGASLYSGSQPLITSSVDKYQVELETFAGATTSTTYTFRTQCQWHGQEAITLHFKNRKGGFDTFDFRLARRKFSDVSRSTFQKNLGTLSGTTWTYTTKDRGTTVFNQQITDRIIADSDWITSTDSTWLQQLIESPEVYYNYQQETLIPVVIKTATAEVKNTRIEKLFNIQIEFEYANKRWTQRG